MIIEKVTRGENMEIMRVDDFFWKRKIRPNSRTKLCKRKTKLKQNFFGSGLIFYKKKLVEMRLKIQEKKEKKKEIKVE